MKNIITLLSSILIFLTTSCNQKEPTETNSDELKDIGYETFIYAYPMMEQVKTINGMFEFMNMKTNAPSMNSKFPMDNVGMPIVAPNLTSMTGGIFIDISAGPVTVEIPEVKDRYIVYQCIDVFTHNFFYMGTRANNGESGSFTFHNKSQTLTENNSTPVLMEGDFAIMVVRIDIKDRAEVDDVIEIQNAIRVTSAPSETRNYPTYDKEKAFTPAFVEYINELITEVPEDEVELFDQWAAIGILSDVALSEEEMKEVQSGIDSAYIAIQEESKNLEIGNGYVAATEVFGTREFLDGNYLARATGANFGLWGNSKEEANYFLLSTEGVGTIRFTKDELPPLSSIGFWSITIHDENVLVEKNEYDSYVLTMDKMEFEENGSLELKISSLPEEGNWLYTQGGKMVIVIRAYQTDPDKIGSYIPPAFTRTMK